MMNVTVDIIALDSLSRSGTSAAHMVGHHLAHMAKVGAGQCGCELGKLGVTAMHAQDGVTLLISEAAPGYYVITGGRLTDGASPQHRARAPHRN